MGATRVRSTVNGMLTSRKSELCGLPSGADLIRSFDWDFRDAKIMRSLLCLVRYHGVHSQRNDNSFIN